MDLCYGGVAISSDDARVLRRLAEGVPGTRFLEVGSWAGCSTVVLGEVARAREGRVYAVDHWRGNAGTWLDGYTTESQILAMFRANLRDLGLADVVCVMWMESGAAAEVLQDGAFDLVFLDGDHRPEAVRRDLELWTPKVHEGGILCGHDYAPEAAWHYDVRAHAREEYWCGFHPGLICAVDEAFGERVQSEERVWWVEV